VSRTLLEAGDFPIAFCALTWYLYNVPAVTALST
jgi:hypothetical protein